MSRIVFFQAKNGSTTCTCAGLPLHSAYNPEREAERFVSAQEYTFLPQNIIVTGPALSYTADILRQKFPQAALIAVRYSTDFSASDSKWDSVLYYTSQADLENRLYTMLGEEGLAETQFLSWQPGAAAFPKENTGAWNAIKQAVVKSRAVLATRTYFARRWYKNCCTFVTELTSCMTITGGSAPVIVAASGPSLGTCLEQLRQYRHTYFLLAVSSALEPLLNAGIRPDACISTDGGYYAKAHLDILTKHNPGVPLLLAAEAACRPQLLRTCAVVPLTYRSFPEAQILNSCGIPSLPAERNGTVSGTAVELALRLTTGPVYCCGLDLAPAKGYQHLQPNALERSNRLTDSRLRPLCTRLSAAGLPSESLNIYRDWFSTRSAGFYSRVFRLSGPYTYANTLGTMRELTWNDITLPGGITMPHLTSAAPLPAREKRRQALKECLQRLSESEEWIKNVCPADYITWQRALKQADRARLQEAAEEKSRAVAAELLSYIGAV